MFSTIFTTFGNFSFLGNKPLQNGVCFFVVVFFLRKDFLSVDLDKEERQKYPFPSLQIKYHIQEKGKPCALLSANHRHDKNPDAIFKRNKFHFSEVYRSVNYTGSHARCMNAKGCKHC